MKTINYTGSSKLISRIVSLLNRKAPLPLDGDGDPDWGTNGQVLTTDGSGNTSWTSGGGSDGHIIQDNGTDMTSRAKLDFVGATVTDDAVNDATVVKFSQAQADWNEADNTKADYIKNKPSIPAAQIQSDWSQSDSSAVDFIKNKPTIPSSSGHTIWNRIKTALTARANLWFKDANVSDASTDGATAVEVVTELASESAFDNLAMDGSADGAYVFPDSGDEYLTADMVGYNNGSVGDALDDINDELTPSTALTFAAGNISYVNNVRRTEYVKVGKVVNFNIFFDLGASPSNGSVLFTINDSSLFPKINSVVPLVGVYNNTAFKVNLSTTGNIEFNSTQPLSANLFYAISGTYICV